MNTILVLVVAVALFYWCGAGPTFFLLRKPGVSRIAALPVVGLCSGVLFTIFLARFGLTGQQIALAALGFFGIWNILVLRWKRPSLPEVQSYVPVALCCVAAAALTAWPLVRMGYSNYWGFANPDHALYISIIDYLNTHSFGVAPAWFRGSFHTLDGRDVSAIGYNSSVILGISYFISMLSLLTRVPVALLFGVLTAAVASIVPSATFVLCSFGLQLEKRVSLTAAAFTAASSLVAYTFYLHSLGAMTVIAILPVGIAITLEYFRDPNWRNLFVAAILFAGAYFDYFPAFGILGLATGCIALWLLVTRRASFRAGAVLAACVVGGLLALSTTHAITIFHRLLLESGSGGAQFSRTNELLLTFALVLTERGLPFFWGLWLPYGEKVALFPSFGIQVYVGVVLGAMFFFWLALAAWRKISGVRAEYICGIGALLGLILLYTVRGDGGYGAFKLIAWIHPLIVVLLVSSSLGCWQWLRDHEHRAASLLPLLVLGLYVTLNIVNAIHLGQNSLGGERATLNNAQQLQLRDFRELQAVADQWGKDGIVVALPDSVAQNWLVPFFRNSNTQFFPQIHLNVEESAPRIERKAPLGHYVLLWADDSQELAGEPVATAMWRNSKFVLTPSGALRDRLVFGRGWYRKEDIAESTFDWQHHFRWLRKRGEFLILKPSPQPKRLLLELVSGYGNPSAARHVDLLVNGQKFDEIDFRARARVLTRPFEATLPWSQVELVVHEDAHPIARQDALWNRWVPADARALNIALAAVSLVDASDSDGLTESVMDFGAKAPPQGLLNGVFPDGWMGAAANMTLRVPATYDCLEITGAVPGARTLAFPYRIPVSLDGAAIYAARIAAPGEFHVRIPLAGTGLVAGRDVNLTLGPVQTFNGQRLGTSSDGRDLSLLLKHVGIVSGARPDADRARRSRTLRANQQGGRTQAVSRPWAHL